MTPNSYAAEVIAAGSGKWSGDTLRFATLGEAAAYIKTCGSRIPHSLADFKIAATLRGA